MHDDGTMPVPPYAVQDNPLTWLEHFDLVFVDPPHTGYSVAANDDARKKMLRWTATSMRSPRWCASGWRATSAGARRSTWPARATARRAARRSPTSCSRSGVALSGLILVSCAMDLQCAGVRAAQRPALCAVPAGVRQRRAVPRPAAGPLAASPEAARAAAEAFVDEDYLGALHAGARLDGKARTRIEKRMAELTGLPRALVEEKNLRISDDDVLLRAAARRGPHRRPARVARHRPDGGEPHARVGVRSRHRGACTRPTRWPRMAYFARDSAAPTTQRYEVLSFDVHKPWNWNRGEDKGNGFASTSPELSRALRRNPHLRVLVASGHYDLGTPYSASDWSLAQLDVPADVLARVEHRYYDAGHMMYTRRPTSSSSRPTWQAGSTRAASAGAVARAHAFAALLDVVGRHRCVELARPLALQRHAFAERPREAVVDDGFVALEHARLRQQHVGARAQAPLGINLPRRDHAVDEAPGRGLLGADPVARRAKSRARGRCRPRG